MRLPVFAVDTNSGLLRGARHLRSPNQDARPEGIAIDLIVIHGISLPPGAYGGPWIDLLFTNALPADAHPYFAGIADLRVSAHLLIRRSGEVVQYVSFGARAWHAGASRYGDRQSCNDFSIGIELEGSDHAPYEDAQYRVLAKVAAALIDAYPGLSPDRMVGHCDIAPGRKTDPGPAFDWPRARRLVDLAMRAGGAQRPG
ncbi:MAG: 1,6-anhydro-N-acetylmuramyl-L-alanine amidase AmpD [Gammaproteobacteria bacterium]|nr:1,6-anhydro-N-acetylmuramyl-L-alanine amidase AmpD [Gammaproteobacteria bacterium]